MKKQIFLGSALIAGTILQAEEIKKPNIVFILADDLGYGDVSALNENSKIKTSHIDKLCETGIKFTDAHSNSSVSTPSRYGILTGRYAFRTTLKEATLAGFSAPLIPKDRSTIATMLSKQGYNTACIGKWHLGWNWAYNEKKEVDYSKPITEGPTTRGFNYFYGISASLDMSPYVYVENDKVTALPDKTAPDLSGILLQRKGPQGADFEHEDCLPNFSKRAIKYIEEQKKTDRPFFLYLPLTAPHTPILPTVEYQGKSGLSPYGDFVLMIDDLVGNILSTLKENGLYDNTIVIFTSDNGCAPYADMKGMEAQGHYPSFIYRGAKSDLYDGGHRIPLIISWGEKYDNQVESGIISLTDFYATFAEMTGYEMPDNEGEDSFSMYPLLSGKGKSLRKDIVHHSIDGYFSIRSAEWKLLFCAGSGGWSFPQKNEKIISELPPVQLYNLKEDIGEKNNLESRYPEIVEKLTAAMREYLLNGRSTSGEKQANDTSVKWEQTILFME